MELPPQPHEQPHEQPPQSQLPEPAPPRPPLVPPLNGFVARRPGPSESEAPTPQPVPLTPSLYEQLGNVQSSPPAAGPVSSEASTTPPEDDTAAPPEPLPEEPKQSATSVLSALDPTHEQGSAGTEPPDQPPPERPVPSESPDEAPGAPTKETLAAWHGTMEEMKKSSNTLPTDYFSSTLEFDSADDPTASFKITARVEQPLYYKTPIPYDITFKLDTVRGDQTRAIAELHSNTMTEPDPADLEAIDEAVDRLLKSDKLSTGDKQWLYSACAHYGGNSTAPHTIPMKDMVFNARHPVTQITTYRYNPPPSPDGVRLNARVHDRTVDPRFPDAVTDRVRESLRLTDPAADHHKLYFYDGTDRHYLEVPLDAAPHHMDSLPSFNAAKDMGATAITDQELADLNRLVRQRLGLDPPDSQTDKSN